MAPGEKLGNRSGHRGKVNYDVVALELPADHMGWHFMTILPWRKRAGSFEL